MKRLFFLLFLIGSVTVFGQSAKKLNENLRARFLLEQKKQDSCRVIFLNSTEKLQKEIELVEQKKQLLIEEARIYRDLQRKIWRFESTLESLEPGLNQVRFRSEDIPAYQDVIRPVKNALTAPESFDKVSNRLYLDMMKPKEQNTALAEKIREYELKEKENKLRIQRNEQNKLLLEPIPGKLDSLLILYKAYTLRLEEKKNAAEKIYQQKKENYRLKGPKGFPDAYQFVFPDVHPTPKDEMTYEVEVAMPLERPKDFGTATAPQLKIYEYVDEIASFPGGMTALKKYLVDNVVYPEAAKELGVSGKVYVKFVVSDQGIISDAKIMKGFPDCEECNNEVIRVVKSMPNWIPAKKDGKNVHSYFSLPVIFKP